MPRRGRKNKLSQVSVSSEDCSRYDAKEERNQYSAMLEDFDRQVEEKLKAMDNSLNKILDDHKRAYNLLLMKKPKEVRQMLFIDYVRNFSEIENSEDEVAAPSVHHNTNKENSPPIPSTSGVKVKGHLTSRKSRTSRKPAMTTNTGRRLRSMSTPCDSRRIGTTLTKVQSSESLKIPNTITPKFNPGKAFAACRIPRHDEVAVSMDGSPLMISGYQHQQRVNALIPLPDGKVWSITAEAKARPSEFPDLDQKTHMALHKLQLNIQRLLSKNPNDVK